ncbi:MAG: hypothetical protein AAF392_01120 [Bacteroidota bacterium]
MTENRTGKEGRALIGRAAISPIDLGKGYSNIPTFLLDKVQGMILLNKRFTDPHEKSGPLHGSE